MRAQPLLAALLLLLVGCCDERNRDESTRVEGYGGEVVINSNIDDMIRVGYTRKETDINEDILWCCVEKESIVDDELSINAHRGYRLPVFTRDVPPLLTVTYHGKTMHYIADGWRIYVERRDFPAE